ncbi:hypothetical protein [Metabacillus sp. Hm71]|uniref:hypothetical protein n=1 Tax=Metabacillus sp. Hm71 TaxID=3450743 RepID=UPI003F43525D
MDKNKVLELCMDVRNNTSSVEGQTPEQRKKEMVELFSVLLKDYDRNKVEINAIIKENVNEALKVKVGDALSVIADVSYVGHGEKKEYNVRNGRLKVEYVALGSEIRRQKIYKQKITAQPKALGAAVYAEWDDVLAGRAESFTEMIDEIAEAINAEVMKTIQTTFVAGMGSAPAANKYSGAFSLAQVRNVANTVSAYGRPVIVGTSVALANITSDSGFKSAMSDAMKDAFNRDGFIGTWEGKALVQLPNTFTDEKNTTWVLDNNLIYVLPVNADKPVKVTFEGGAEMLEKQSYDDGSIEKKTLQKVGVNVLQVHNLGLVTIV